jgi:hypothetical protein
MLRVYISLTKKDWRNKVMDMKHKRGPKGKGGIRIILHIWPQQLEAIEKALVEDGGSRAELIRRAIDAYLFQKRRKSDREANS